MRKFYYYAFKSFLLVTLICGFQGLYASNPGNIGSDETTMQTHKVAGKVIDENKQPLIGALIEIKGTPNGVITDHNGAFVVNAKTSDVLVVSFMGYKKKEISAQQSAVTIQLEPDALSVDEVVVVGYGTQKKVNLSGAVSSVNVADMVDSRPVTNISNALAGMAPGLSVNTSNNRPSNNGSASITIRGQGTLNNASPLVIIDGVEASMNSVNPQDVESISILKDAASAAIYGSRAANGVILITTKKGVKGSVKFDYSGYVSFESMDKSRLSLVTNYADYMGYINEGMKNSNKPEPFSKGMIDLWRANEGGDQIKYPNTDILSIFDTAASHQHNFSASGGNDKVTFYTSFNYLNNPGIMENSGYERFNLRSNVDAKVTDWFRVGTNISGYIAKSEIGTNGIDDAFTYIGATTPGMYLRHPDGRYGGMNNPEDDSQSGINNPLARLNGQEGNIRTNLAKARMYATLSPVKGLTIQGSYTYEFYNNGTTGKKPVFIDRWDFLADQIQRSGKGRTSISNSDTKQYRNFMDGVIRYENKFFNEKFDLGVMVGASQEQFHSESFSASRQDLLDPSLGVIDGAVGESSTGGSASEWAMRSYFGRINLGWDNKYLLEVNLRADGSSRFTKENRWGYFPSFSAAWRISEEKFMKNISWLDNLKIRASYGSLGNNSIGNYDSQSLYSATNYVLNRALAMGLSQTAIANTNVTWESTNITNVGLDFGVLKNRLTGTIEFFNKMTDGILISLPAPMVHGNASIPKTNAAQVTNRGLELQLNWNDNVGAFNYYVGGNFTYIKNNVDKFRGDFKAISGSTMLTEGMPMNINYTLRADRIVSTDEDLALIQGMIDANPVDAQGNKITVFPYGRPEKGDILYKDLDGNGAINDDDREAYGSGSTPKFTYGINLGASWKGIDFSMLLQGSAGIKGGYTSGLLTPNIRWGYQLNQDIVDGRWYEGRTTPATYPRLLESTNTINTRSSDFWIMSRAYLKIRNIQLGYSLPKKWMDKIQMDKIRIYGSLENFFTFTKYKGVDPEVGSLGYPAIKQAVIGVNITF
ncbi:MAG: TonB-dependent receptor [Rikenellaceae bacterium]